MQLMDTSFKRALTSGTVAGITTVAAAVLAGRRETGSYAAPINATSHIVWGDQAAMKNAPSLKYTLTGFLLNHAATIFWAGIHDHFFGEHRTSHRVGKQRSALRPLVGSAVVAASAYLTDYYLVPKRLTPGFERRLSDKSLALVFGALAFGLAIGNRLARKY